MKVNVALFEDEFWQNFSPLTLTKATFDLVTGSKTAFDLYKPNALFVRDYLADMTRERHPGTKVNPASIDGDTIFFNGLFAGQINGLLKKYMTRKFVFAKGNRIVATHPSKLGFEHIADSASKGLPIDMKKLESESEIKVDLDSSIGNNILSNPWEIIINLRESLRDHLSQITRAKKARKVKGVKVFGKGRASIEEGAKVEEGTVIDTSEGDVLVERGAIIQPSRIIGPAFIGSQTQVKQFSIIAESHIGRNCRVAGEIELSVVSDYTNKAHLGFLGHSYVGEWVNIGASTNTSDLKMTYGNVKVNTNNGLKIDSGTNKLGSFFGDMSKTSIGTLVFSGRRIGISSHLYGSVTEDVPSFTIFGKGISAENVELEMDSAIQTQRKMMSRRNKAMSEGYERMMKHVFEMTQTHRRASSVESKKFVP